MKILVAAPALLDLSHFLRLIEQRLRSRGIKIFTQQYMCIWAYICKTRQLL